MFLENKNETNRQVQNISLSPKKKKKNLTDTLHLKVFKATQ